MHRETDVFGDRQNSRRDPRQSIERRLQISAFLHTEGRELRVRVRNSTLDARTQPFRMPQVEHAHSASRNLVLVGWTDSASRCSDLFARRADRIDELVIRKNEMNAIAYVESSLNVDAVGDELVDLRKQRFGIEDNSVSNRAAYAGMKNPTRNLMQHE